MATALEATLKVINEIAQEREGQRTREGYDIGHDDEHDAGELARAGATYALLASDLPTPIALPAKNGAGNIDVEGMALLKRIWPWSDGFKSKGARRNLIRAAALIVAEIEKFDRNA